MAKKFKVPSELFDLMTDFSRQVCDLANRKCLLYLDLMEKAVEILSKVVKEMREEEKDAQQNL